MNAKLTFLILVILSFAIHWCDASGQHSVHKFDLVIRGGRVVDGTGNPAFFADVAVDDGRIAAVGKLNRTGEQELDASGLIVAPGFIDVHTHAEGVEKLPEAKNFLRMGVTTLVLGNCGSSQLDLGDYFKVIEEVNVSPNIASLIGHGTVRREAMGGSLDRSPTNDELEGMKDLIDRAMRQGAVGLSTGLIYLPGSFSQTDELIELSKVVSAYAGVYASHMRNENVRIFDALDELFKIAREAQVRAHISHIKLSGRAAWHQTVQVLTAIENARDQGLDITQDQYMYDASSTGIQSRIPNWARAGGRSQFNERLNDPETKARIIREMKESLTRYGHDDFSYARIAYYEHDPSLNGLNIPQAAQKIRGSDSLEDQIELMLEVNGNGGASGVFHSMNESDLQNYLRHPNTMIAADSGVREYQKGVPHPRGYGNNARCLSRYVRELELLHLEDAIRRMTSLPATTFRLKNRGMLREGNWADLVVFNPKTIRDNATFEEPHQYATGFAAVLVNGKLVVKNDRHTGARPGRIIRRGQD